jgi:protein-disulfide isomerase
MKNPWVIIGISIVVLFGGAIWLSESSAEQNNEGVVVETYVKGNPKGDVTLVKYSDFSCPSCAQASTVVDGIMAEVGDRVRFEYRHFPFLGQGSTQAAMATEAAGQQGQFYEMHDLIFENQAEWVQTAVPSVSFARYAEELGLDMDLYQRHLDASLLREKVQAQFSEGRERGVTGTPTFFLNGNRMSYDTYQEFEAQIVAAITGTTPGAATSSVGGTETEVRFGL